MLEWEHALPARAQAVVQKFFYLYLEQCDWEQLLPLLDPEITWLNTNENVVCHNCEQVLQHLRALQAINGSRFCIVDYRSWAVGMDENHCNVYGTMKLQGDNNLQGLEWELCFSMLCKQHSGGLRLFHAHFSMQSIGQKTAGYGQEPQPEYDSKRLETKLQECAAQLQKKMQELANMESYIAGGFEICAMDEAFTIRESSNGFSRLVGYTPEELRGMSHMSLVYPADRALLHAQMMRQLESGAEFSLTYRILRKHGEVRWVLDNGRFLPAQKNEDKAMHCFLTDITEQKRQEEEQRINQKRYEVVLQQLDVSMFEYNIVTKQLILYEEEASLYNLPTVIEDGPQVLAQSGYFDAACVPAYLEMYHKICSGEEPIASCMVTSHDIDGNPHEFELRLTAVLDDAGVPIRAIGMKKKTSHLRRLQREQEFGKSMTGSRTFLCEADLTTGCILHIDAKLCQETGVSNTSLYSQVTAEIVRCAVQPEERTRLQERFAAKHLVELLEQGKHLDQFSFRMESPSDKVALWYEVTVNLIRDELTGNVCVRIYREDISDRKHKELQANEERRLYESMRGRAIVAYEINVTRDLVLRGHEHWAQQLGIQTDTCYSKMLNAFTQQATDSKGGEQLRRTFARDAILHAYGKGERELSCQYCKRDGTASIWAECTVHLFEDPESGDVRGYAYVENIDKKKRAELALRYKAEHDAHTGLYNKATTVDLIRQYVSSLEGKSGLHAFLMIDMDHFKEINDRYGHLVGDKVIAEVGSRIRALFRDDDIVGRVGGDEFCVFMKQVEDVPSVETRTSRLCRALTQCYSDGENVCDISASVGIALYPEQGRSFEELYHRADSALYKAKRGGRNRYALAE